MASKFYSDEFESFWKEYNAPKNSSKTDAYKVFCKIADVPVDLLCACATAYNEWLLQNSRPDRPYPKCHASTWLRGRRFDGFLDQAQRIIDRRNNKAAAAQANIGSWEGEPYELLTTRGRVTKELFDVWFAQTVFVPGHPPEIKCPTKMVKNWLSEKLIAHIVRAFGPEVRIT